jgi:DNA-binding NarL/FixJ family response regulator
MLRIGDGGQLDAVIIDVRLPDGDGVSLCKEIRSRFPDAQRIAHTGLGDDSIPPGLFHSVLPKPSTVSQIKAACLRGRNQKGTT